jgi:hypothetical protein
MQDNISMMGFKPSVDGLHYYDFGDSIKWKHMQEQKQRTMVISTVEEIK